MRLVAIFVFISAVVSNLDPLCSDTVSEIQGLSSVAQDSLVAHFDGRKNVATTGNVVDSWTPVDAFGNNLGGMIVNSTQRGNGAAELISYDGSGTLSFDDTSVSADGRYLSGTLSNAGGSAMTVFWRGHYDANAPFDTSGTYAYNIGLSDISHQRDDCGSDFCVEVFNGTTFAGDSITAFDSIDTVWSTVVTANSHATYANGIDLNLQGSPTYNVAQNADIVVGAFSGGGFDMIGDIQQLLIFESALSNNDRVLVENYLNSIYAIPEPTVVLPLMFAATSLCVRRKRNTLKGEQK